jgi:hypothetical protein
VTASPRNDPSRMPLSQGFPAIPLERAQLVWRRAVTLAGPARDSERAAQVLDLLQAADQDLSAMCHALTLGRAHQRSNPGDVPARHGVELLARSIAWLGPRTVQGEVGSVRHSTASGSMH